MMNVCRQEPRERRTDLHGTIGVLLGSDRGQGDHVMCIKEKQKQYTKTLLVASTSKTFSTCSHFVPTLGTPPGKL
jgi:hypothetical protein